MAIEFAGLSSLHSCILHNVDFRKYFSVSLLILYYM